MGLETATFVTDLVPANPTSTDLRAQGDDHLRLLKAVLQGTFPTANKAWYTPIAASRSVDFTIVAADMNKTFSVDTSAGIVNATLPTLAAGDIGWECIVMKTNTGANPVLIKPASGTMVSGSLAGLTACRRSIPGSRIRCLWLGSIWHIERATNLPLGSCLELHNANLPVGYEWPNGQTLASAAANYPEYNALVGSGLTLDKRGRIGIPLDNLGGASAGRLAGGIITPTAVGNTGGTDTVTLSLAQTPVGITSANASQNISVTTSAGGGSFQFARGQGAAIGGFSPNAASGGVHTHPDAPAWDGLASISGTTANAIGVTSNNTGGGAHSNLQPSIMITQALVVE